MDISEIKKGLATLQLRTDLTEEEVKNREQLKFLLATLEDTEKEAGIPARKDGEKMFPGAYVTELREEAKSQREAKRRLESDKAILEARFGSIDLEDYAKLQEERAEQIKIQQEAEIERRKKEGEFDSLLAEAQTSGADALTAKENEMNLVIAEYKEKLSALSTENSNLFFADQFNRAIAEAKLQISDHEGVRLRLEREQVLKMDENGRKSIVLMNSATGEERLDDSGKSLSLSARLKQLHDDEITSYMFKSARQGAGSFTSTVKDQAPLENEIEYFNTSSIHHSVTEQARIYNEDPKRYDKLFAMAMKL